MNESKATRYQRLRRRAHAAGLISGGLLLAALALTPASGWLARWARGVGQGLTGVSRSAVTLVAFVGLAVVLWEAVALPAVLYLGLRVDRRFRLIEHTVEGMLAAQAQATLVALPAALVGVGVVAVCARLAGAWWWAAAGAALAVVVLAALHLAPVIVARIARTRPLDQPQLVARLTDLARRAGVSIDRVDELDTDGTSGTTALVTGVGRARRIFVSSEIVRDWSPDEIAVVVAHELAHHAHHDLWRTLALDAAFLSAGLGIADVVLARVSPALPLAAGGTLTSLPLIALVAGAVWLVATPLRHAQSRLHEHRADGFALALTGGADAFGAAIRRLGARHLAEERPTRLTRWLYHRHPSVAERLAMAEGAKTQPRAR